MTHEPEKSESTSEQTLVGRLEAAAFSENGTRNGTVVQIDQVIAIVKQHEAEVGCPYENQKQAYQAGLADAKHHQSLELEECRQRNAELVDILQLWWHEATGQFDKKSCGHAFTCTCIGNQVTAALAKHKPFHPDATRSAVQNPATLLAKGEGV